jgi:dTDP-4-amino-4,6-dideoxygalactose transaminase
LPSAAPDNLSVAAKLAERVIYLPMYHEINEKDINKIVACIKKQAN